MAQFRKYPVIKPSSGQIDVSVIAGYAQWQPAKTATPTMCVYGTSSKI
jgi:hypothetical protein